MGGWVGGGMGGGSVEGEGKGEYMFCRVKDSIDPETLRAGRREGR
jgi:hypothetical protein